MRRGSFRRLNGAFLGVRDTDIVYENVRWRGKDFDEASHGVVAANLETIIDNIRVAVEPQRERLVGMLAVDVEGDLVPLEIDLSVPLG